MSFAGAWGPPNLGDGESGRQDGGQIEDSRRGQVELRFVRILTASRLALLVLVRTTQFCPQ